MIINENLSVNIFSKFTIVFLEQCKREIVYLTNWNTMGAGIALAVAVIVGIAASYFLGILGVIFGIISTAVLTGVAIWLIHDGRRKEQNKVIGALIHKLHDPIDKLLNPLEEIVDSGKNSIRKIFSDKNNDQGTVSEKSNEREHRKTIEKVIDVLRPHGETDPCIQKIIKSTEKLLVSEKEELHIQKENLEKVKKCVTATLTKIGTVSKHHLEFAGHLLKENL